MIKAYRAADVRAAEAPLLAAGEPLMERASGALALATIREVSASGRPVYGCRAFVLAGGGDNGGDALYAAARLAARGMSVKAFVPGRAHEGGLAAALRAGVRLAELEEARRADVWIDGLVGIGARGPLREPLASHVRALSGMRSGQRVVAVDVPSGIGTDDGTVPGPVLDCDLTVTMGAPKPGLYLEPARRHAGRVEVADIGLSLGEPALVSLQEEDARGMWPVPGPDSHKYTRGVLGVMAGSRRYPGAGFLCADAALAAGPGMVRYAGPRDLADRVAARHPECVLGEGRVDAWVIGPGVDMDDERAASEAARRLQLVAAESLPVVLDAGAIALAATAECDERVVLTPHAGELANLLTSLGEAVSRREIEAAPARAARLAATATGATVLLKGPVDVACTADGPLYAQSGPAWRATAGAGDVLAGLLGAVLAQGVAPLPAAALAAFVHGRACPRRPVRAGDIAAAVAPTLADLTP